MIKHLFGSRTWLALAYVVLGLPVGILTSVVILVGLSTAISLLPLFLFGLAVLIATGSVAGRFATFERRRAAVFLDVVLPARPRSTPLADAGWLRRTWSASTSAVLWKELSYGMLLLPVGAICYSVAVAIWSIAAAGVLLPAYAFALPGNEVSGWVHWSPLLEIAAGFAAGVLALLTAPAVTRGLAAAQLAMVRALLVPSGSEVLAARVSSLTESRARVVDAADAERRRIERDLHDGAQQHLVSLAMNLGMAKEKLDSDPTAARDLIVRAHQEAKDSIVELRNVIRGVYPAVLTDRGLDAALSALAARSPVPVQIEVDLPHRPSRTTEAIAYFVVSEALTNVARHSGASRVSVHVEQREDRIQVAVVDDGRGGAREGSGSGLAGLRDRVRAVDGTFQLISPAGVGTTIAVEVPCAS